jgi:nucleoside-diphosphate-sugar epimerase
MHVLIIGGTKFIGPHIVQLLHQNGHQITLFHRGETIYPFSFPVNLIKGDRSNLIDFRKQFSALSPDIVIDMVLYSENDANQVIKVFCGIIKRLIVISSCDVYRAYDRLWKVFTHELILMPLNEGSELRENFYPYRKMMASRPSDWSDNYEKILVENTIRACPDISSTILRLPMVYGPGDYSRLYPYLKRMDDDRPILLDENKAQWHFCRGYVEDIANAIMLSALDTRSGNRMYNVGEINAYSEMEWIQLIGHVAGWKNKIITVPHDKLPPHLAEPSIAWEQDLTTDTTLIRRELNYKELSLPEEAMRTSIDWVRNHGPTQIDHALFNYDAEDSVIAEGRSGVAR